MKYIITESQNKKLHSLIVSYFDTHLTPFDGWDDDIVERVNEGKEFFFWLDEDGDETMWYSACDNADLPEELVLKNECPLVTIPETQYDTLNDLFGNIWIPLFKVWFESKTGLEINNVDAL